MRFVLVSEDDEFDVFMFKMGKDLRKIGLWIWRVFIIFIGGESDSCFTRRVEGNSYFIKWGEGKGRGGY